MAGGSMIGRGNGRQAFNATEPDSNIFDRFSWANGMFGQMIIELEACYPGLLAESYQQE